MFWPLSGPHGAEGNHHKNADKDHSTRNKTSAGLLALEAPEQISSTVISCCVWLSGRKGELFLYPESTANISSPKTNRTSWDIEMNSTVLKKKKQNRTVPNTSQFCTNITYLRFFWARLSSKNLYFWYCSSNFFRTTSAVSFPGCFIKESTSSLKGRKTLSVTRALQKSSVLSNRELHQRWKEYFPAVFTGALLAAASVLPMPNATQQEKPSDQG